MVNRGRPSTGCGTCKNRRIKCDKRRPTCYRCSKAKRNCPGYVNEFDLLLRNETVATEKRAWKAVSKDLTNKARKDSSPISRPAPSSGKSVNNALSSRTSFCPAASSSIHLPPANSQLARRSSFAQQPTVPLLEQASHHFVSNFVLTPPQNTERGYLEFLPHLINGKPDNHFRLAFEAVSLASLGSRVGSGVQIEEQALGKYTAALAAISRAIQDPAIRSANDTVAAVLLLGFFEIITSRHPSIFALGYHIEGAIQLVKNRGADQLLTKQGLDIFVAVRTQQIIYSFGTGKALSMGTDRWAPNATKDLYGMKCQNITLQVIELKTKINDLLKSLNRDKKGINLIKDLIKTCQERDRECIQWSKTLPKYLQCKTVAWVSSVPNGDYQRSELFPGRLDAFQDVWAASVWNTLRCSRIMLSTLILRAAAWACSPSDYRATPEYVIYSRIGIELVADIVASIPYQLGWFSKRRELLGDVSLTSYCCGEDNTLKSVAGYFVTWPLSFILTHDYSTDDQKTWVRGRLHYVADTLGIRYAKMLTQLSLRIPSMLIQRDAAVNGRKRIVSSGFETMLSAETMPPPGLQANSL